MDVPIIDLTDAICEADTCRAIVGNVLAWRDSNHLTATYVRTLAPTLGAAMQDAFAHYASMSDQSPAPPQ